MTDVSFAGTPEQWLPAGGSCVEPQPVYYVRSSYATTKRLNKVSKESVLCGSDNIGVKGRTIIESGAVLRGDLATIELGSYCVIGARSVVRPPEQSLGGLPPHARASFIPMTIGDHVLIEHDSIIEAASIGECTHIGAGCIVGPRCVVSACSRLLAGAVLPAGTVTAPFGVWAGCPAVQVGRLPDAWASMWQQHTTQFYKQFLPASAATAATAALAVGAGAGAATAVSGPAQPAPSPHPQSSRA